VLERLVNDAVKLEMIFWKRQCEKLDGRGWWEDGI